MRRALATLLLLVGGFGCGSGGVASPDGATSDGGGRTDGGVTLGDAGLADAASPAADAALADAGSAVDSRVSDAGVRDAGGSDARRTCSDVRQEYSATIAAALACAPNLTLNQCTLKVPESIGCDCEIFVNFSQQAKLGALATEWQDMQCTALCPLILCVEPTSGECNAATMICRTR